ncbi:gamma carbonic anhydrase family protein [Candidatus Neomarinimicrobiota bacterium]
MVQRMILPFRDKTPIVPVSAFVAQSVDVIGDVQLGEHANIWHGTVVRGDMNYIRIGARTNIQDNSTIHVTTDLFPTIVGDEVTVGHNVILHGCVIQDRVLIGMGAIVMDGAIVEEGAYIGAGALVSPGTVVPARTLWTGLPAKYRRDVTVDEYQEILDSADHYIEFAAEYKALGVGLEPDH